MSPPIANKYPWRRKVAAAFRFPILRCAGYPTVVNLEVTRKCNARCGFCRYWKTKSETVLEDYAPVVCKLKPVVLVFMGGEALLRRDLSQLVARVREACPSVFLSLVTNGWFLSVPRALALWNAGIDQITVSLDFLDERHDRARRIPGLTRRILEIVPKLMAAGINNITLESFIRRDNLDAVPEVVSWAKDHGVKSVISSYTPAKTGIDQLSVTPNQLPALRALVNWLLARKLEGGPITSSNYFLSRIPGFFATGSIDGCPAGYRFIIVSPAGEIQRCSEMPAECDYRKWRPGLLTATECGRCWVPCRGESQAPLNWAWVRQAVSSYRDQPAVEVA